MATLVGNAKYGEGHEIILKDKISSVISTKFIAAGYTPGKSVFSLVKTPTRKFDRTIEITSGSDSIVIKDASGKVVLLMGSASSINGTFNHHSANAKSNTGALTELKENISMMMFQSHVESNTTLSEDDVINQLKPSDKLLYDTSYYTSAVKQTAELKPYVGRFHYTYERQGQGKTKILYEKARKVTGLANDNWNPADVWMIDSEIKSFKDLMSVDPTATEINDVVAAGIKSKSILPISLKHVERTSAVSEIVDSANILADRLELDLSFQKVDLSDTFNNFILQTKSGFAARVGFKASASTLNVSIEGRMIGTKYQMGAVDAKYYTEYCNSKYGYSVRSKSVVGARDMDIAKKELKEITNKFSRISNTLTNYNHIINEVEKGTELTKKRFANLISYLYSFLIVPGRHFEEHMKMCYYSAKKMSSNSSTYILIK